MWNDGAFIHFIRRSLRAFDLRNVLLDNKEAQQGVVVSLLKLKYLLEVTVAFLWSKTHGSLLSHTYLLQKLCSVLDCLLTPEKVPMDCPRELEEMYFIFACIWAFGGVLSQDQVSK